MFEMAMQCAHGVAPETMAAIVSVESSGNPYAIGVVGGRLQRQPQNLAEAVATVKKLAAEGRNFSVGLAQVNQSNFAHYGLTLETAFDPCQNLRVGAAILRECYTRAGRGQVPGGALRAALSCYYSGNFTRGQRPDAPGELSYVDKVFKAAGMPVQQNNIVPAIELRQRTPAPRGYSMDAFEGVQVATTVNGVAAVEEALAGAAALVNANPEPPEPPAAPVAAPAPATPAGVVVF